MSNYDPRKARAEAIRQLGCAINTAKRGGGPAVAAQQRILHQRV